MEKQWHYSINGSDKQGPIGETELRDMLTTGRLPLNTLAWSEGQSNWTTAADLFKISPTFSSVVSMGGEPVPAGMTGWLGFIGVIAILTGSLQAAIGLLPVLTSILQRSYLSAFLLTLFLILPILVILTGVYLMKARTALQGITMIDGTLTPVFRNLNKYLRMTSIIYIVNIVLVVLLILCFILFFSVIMGYLTGMLQQVGSR